MIAYSFIFFLAIFIGIGLLSMVKNKGDNADYLLASRSVPPWMAALTALATCNSGYMFTGMIGFTYLYGLQTIWFLFGSVVGDFVSSIFVHYRLRKVSGEQNALSFGEVLAGWQGTDFRWVRRIAGVVTVLFLSIYAAAQFKAGSKALHVLFGWDYSTGAIIGSIIVFLYCMAGGIRASIWTDIAQSCVMIFSMALLLFIGLGKVGGPVTLWRELQEVSPTYTSIWPNGLPWQNPVGIFFFIVGCFFSGLGTIGQPHIMLRFMTLDRPENMLRARVWYYSWYTAFYLITMGVGLVARVFIAESAGFDAELALPIMGKAMLPEVLVGVVLAGIFAASMSTADSQILTCGSAFTRDIFPSKVKKNPLLFSKLATIGVGLFALVVSLYGPKSVFDLVVISWAVLASAFGPLLFVYAMGWSVTEKLAISMVLGGAGVAMVWRYLGLVPAIFEVAPGMLSGILIYFVMRRIAVGFAK